MSAAKPGPRATRRTARAHWPIVARSLEDEDDDDIASTTTPAQRIAMMRELAEAAWQVAGRPLPNYTRQEIPGRWFPPGAPPRDDDDA